MTTQVGIFAKHWTPGRVKTRLAASIGNEAAALVARSFIQTLTTRLAGVAEKQVVGFAPSDSAPAFAELAPAWRLEPQCPGDLGQRMRHYFATAFEAGASRVVLLGADSPNVPVELVAAAFDALQHNRLVLGPTDDGGYYLIGARGKPPPVFDGMPWSEPNLWQATIDRLRSVGWRQDADWHALPPWYDVDTIDDLTRLLADLSAAEDRALADLQRQIEAILN